MFILNCLSEFEFELWISSQFRHLIVNGMGVYGLLVLIGMVDGNGEGDAYCMRSGQGPHVVCRCGRMKGMDFSQKFWTELNSDGNSVASRRAVKCSTASRELTVEAPSLRSEFLKSYNFSPWWPHNEPSASHENLSWYLSRTWLTEPEKEFLPSAYGDLTASRGAHRKRPTASHKVAVGYFEGVFFFFCF